jgi:hypothetical protein
MLAIEAILQNNRNSQDIPTPKNAGCDELFADSGLSESQVWRENTTDALELVSPIPQTL